MQLSKIEVKGLFGFLDHTIPLNTDEKITIIHGPNGMGKTVLLTMIDSIFNFRYPIIQRVPFKDITLYFNSGGKLIVKKETHEENKEKFNQLVFEYREKSSDVKAKYTHIIKPTKRTHIEFPLDIIEHEVPGLVRVAATNWQYLPTQEIFTLDEVLDRFASKLPFQHMRKERDPEWLKEILGKINVRFIETQRLLSYKGNRRMRDYESKTSLVPAVVNYSEEIVNAVQNKLAEYASLSQSFDRLFPLRLVKGKAISDISNEELQKKLTELEEKRAQLMNVGLIDVQKELELKDLQIDETNKKVLDVYIDDVKRKLSVFDDLTNKINLLVKIVNRRFLYKKMTIDKKSGFIFKAINGPNIAPTNLSSGEQHELVLFYELLFKVKPNSLR